MGVNINSETKGEAEAQLKAAILVELNKLDESHNVMLKLTIPTEDNLYQELAEHARVVKVVALSGGYAREEASAKWLWENKNVVPFVKCDKGLCDEVDGCQLMKPNPGLDDLMKRAYTLGVFGTKMRSNINHANEAGVTAIVQQQFEVAKQIIGHGLCPIIEPEVNINSETKGEAEA